ncbi:hypothetical protein QC763_100330 [Podospora pseudopauciseta]|uniref:Uncharacterized protein n=1 Tax=Podospora pseudopauciseta TaxID=2093780 RepID=A0ABR0HVL3_9PEZI|nr:hypothetical protein QC763_100330 [Podospora pseudopauciseta]
MAPLLAKRLDSIIPLETPNLHPRKYFNNGRVNPLAIGLGVGIAVPLIVGLTILYWRQELKKKKRKEERKAEEEILNMRLRGQAARLGAGEMSGPRVSARIGRVGPASGVSTGPGVKSEGETGSGGDRPRNLGLLDITTPLPRRGASPVQSSKMNGNASSPGVAASSPETTAGSEPAIPEPPPAYSKYKPGLLDV